MRKVERHILLPSDDEETRPQIEIAADEDNLELSDDQLAMLRPASEVLQPALYAALTRPRGRPKGGTDESPG